MSLPNLAGVKWLHEMTSEELQQQPRWYCQHCRCEFNYPEGYPQWPAEHAALHEDKIEDARKGRRDDGAMKWLTSIGNVVRWILGIVPQVTPAAPPPVPKKPLTPADLGWDDQEPTRSEKKP